MSYIVHGVLWLFLIFGALQLLLAWGHLTKAAENDELGSWGCIVLWSLGGVALPAFILYKLSQ